MKISLEWLKQFIDLSTISQDELSEIISKGIAEVESQTSFKDINVLVGEIKSTNKLTNSKKLNHATVDVGQSQKLSIIFGDLFPIKKGDRLPIAIAPTVLPTGINVTTKDFFNQRSEGMLVSDKELGISASKEGIFRFPKNCRLGTNVYQYFKMTDPVFDLKITPNRGDLLGLLGFAKDLAALLNRKYINIPVPRLIFSEKDFSGDISILVNCPAIVPRYSAIKISGVKNISSPLWMQKRLLASGIRPINATVDITNYVLLEYNQPLHAFDFERISESGTDRGQQSGVRQIIVRRSYTGEKLETLDQVKRDLPEGSIVIADNKKILALAGIMGGAASGISDRTTQVVIESAIFDPLTIRKTAKKLNLSTEASYRFERKVDPEITVAALKRAAGLILEITGGKITSQIFDLKDSRPGHKNKISFAQERFKNLSGSQISINETLSILRRLNFVITKINKTSLEVQPPPSRHDISLEEDVYEEILRIKGYDHLPISLPSGCFLPPEENLMAKNQDKIASYLAELGFGETINYSFYSLSDSKVSEYVNRQHIKLINPNGPDTAYLRTSLLPGLLRSAATNAVNIAGRIALFEIGNIFYQQQNKSSESCEVAALVLDNNLNNATQAARLAINSIAAIFYQKASIRQDIRSQSAKILIGKQVLGEMIVIDSHYLTFDKKKRLAIFFFLNLEQLISEAKSPPPAQKINSYPTITRDVTFIIASDSQAEKILNDLRTADNLISNVELVDIYQKESKIIILTYRLIYASEKRTLADQEVNQLHQKIIRSTAKKYNLKIK